ncbi:hypothetical protein [Mycobacterium tuberculosis]|uniref:hypothetical protein n=1 Tax=Mycobacterium tuberculosis TaxID=1773 RepID=UPI0027294ECC|nr:hypothetical protein [Mycobacterium tuberculosis]
MSVRAYAGGLWWHGDEGFNVDHVICPEQSVTNHIERLIEFPDALHMVAEGLIDEREAVRRVDPMALDQLLHPTLDPNAERNVLTTGLPASPGAAAGKIVLAWWPRA